MRFAHVLLLRLCLGASCAFAAAPPAPAAPPLLDVLRERNADVAELAGAFTQRKHLKALPVPLVSSGEFTYHASEGLRWHTLEPLDNLVTISEAGIYLSDERLVTDDAKGQAGQVVARLFMAMFSGNIAVLNEYFTIDEQGDAEAWTLQLTPINPTLAEVIAGVELAGGEHTESVTISEASGDTTELTLQLNHAEVNGHPEAPQPKAPHAE